MRESHSAPTCWIIEPGQDTGADQYAAARSQRSESRNERGVSTSILDSNALLYALGICFALAHIAAAIDTAVGTLP